jgi:hypothetical protein
MNTLKERQLAELAAEIAELADGLPSWMDDPPEADLKTFEALQDASNDLWALWREMQVEKDLAA